MVVNFDICVRGQSNVPTSSSMWYGEQHLDGWVLIGWKSDMKFVFKVNKKKALRSLLAITHMFNIYCFKETKSATMNIFFIFFYFFLFSF